MGDCQVETVSTSALRAYFGRLYANKHRRYKGNSTNKVLAFAKMADHWNVFCFMASLFPKNKA